MRISLSLMSSLAYPRTLCSLFSPPTIIAQSLPPSISPSSCRTTLLSCTAIIYSSVTQIIYRNISPLIAPIMCHYIKLIFSPPIIYTSRSPITFPSGTHIISPLSPLALPPSRPQILFLSISWPHYSSLLKIISPVKHLIISSFSPPIISPSFP